MSSCERHLCDYSTIQAAAEGLEITEYQHLGWPTDSCNFWLIEYDSPTMRDSGEYDSGRAWTTSLQCALEAAKFDTISMLAFKIAPSPQSDYMYNDLFRKKMEEILELSNRIPMYFGTADMNGVEIKRLIQKSENSMFIYADQTQPQKNSPG
jgi:hypothetical protein